MAKLYVLFSTCFCLSLFIEVNSVSYFDGAGFDDAENCNIDSKAEGRCIVKGLCETNRIKSDNSTCLFRTCCETKSEDFVEPDYGRVARQECKRYMENREFQNYGFVLGGEDALPKEYTFMAALGYGEPNNVKFHCGGSLISEKHVLTAAHCLFSQEDGPVRYILLGDLDYANTTDDAQPQYLFVENVTVHPEYKRTSSYHDIAILHLNNPAIFTDYVQPACLDFGQLPVTEPTRLHATGWGYIDTFGNRTTHLQTVELVEYNFERCESAYQITRKLRKGIVETQLCAGGVSEKKDTCQGDSGGPLSRRNEHLTLSQYLGYIVVGVTSFGKLCGYTNAPGVYTRVYKYIPWIESVVWPEAVAELAEKKGISDSMSPTQNPVSNIQSNFNVNINPVTSTQPPIEYMQPVSSGDQPQPQFINQPIPSFPRDPVQSGYYTTRKPINLIDVHYFV